MAVRNLLDSTATAIFTDRIMSAVADPYSYDNALAETINGLYKAEVIHRRGPWRSGGGRQIVSFHLAGEILDLQHLLLSRADHSIQAITDATLAWVPAADLRRIAQERPALAEALWRDTLIDASIFREWVLNVGRRDAKSRIAHMLCEFAARREQAGLGSPERFELPMTQEQIGDATGLTSVHVNRMLHELADDGVIVRNKREVKIGASRSQRLPVPRKHKARAGS